MDPTTQGPQIRRRLGVVPQQDSLDMELTVEENLIIYARYFGLSYAEGRKRAEEQLEFVQLSDRAKAEVEPLSGGMKRRLTIARGLINDPDLLLLDEPTTGLDPQARHLLWDRLYRLKRQGVTLILTTHFMDEAEQLCDRLVVMDKAKIVAEGSPRELVAQYATKEVLELRFEPGVQESLDGTLDGLADRDREAARSTAALHRRWRRGRGGRARARTAARERARPAQHARGRLPPAHRPDPDRVAPMTAAVHVLEHNLLVYRRTWQGSLFTTFLAPVLFLLAMGVGLGQFVDQSAADAFGGVSYLVFLAPGLLVSTAMQTAAGESMYPVMSAVNWQRTFHAAVATPRSVARRRHRPTAVAGGPPARSSAVPSRS